MEAFRGSTGYRCRVLLFQNFVLLKSYVLLMLKEIRYWGVEVARQGLGICFCFFRFVVWVSGYTADIHLLFGAC